MAVFFILRQQRTKPGGAGNPIQSPLNSRRLEGRETEVRRGNAQLNTQIRFEQSRAKKLSERTKNGEPLAWDLYVRELIIVRTQTHKRAIYRETYTQSYDIHNIYIYRSMST